MPNQNQPYWNNQPNNFYPNNMAEQNNNMAYNYPYQNNTDAYQQRLNDMAQQVTGNNQQPNFNNMPPMVNRNMAQPNQHPQQRYNIRPVAGYEEVLASPVPFDGSISIFVDFPNGRIYTKQLNMADGTPLTKTYGETENPAPSTSVTIGNEQYVKKADFDELKAKFDHLWEELTKPATSENAESNNNSNQQPDKKGDNK